MSPGLLPLCMGIYVRLEQRHDKYVRQIILVLESTIKTIKRMYMYEDSS